jgi:hypothetical protein
MSYKAIILGVLYILAISQGCTMCCHPYDNCGPVYDASCEGRPYCSNNRAGSILENPPASVETLAPEGAVEENEESVSLTAHEEPTLETTVSGVSADTPEGFKPAKKTIRAVSPSVR